MISNILAFELCNSSSNDQIFLLQVPIYLDQNFEGKELQSEKRPFLLEQPLFLKLKVFLPKLRKKICNGNWGLSLSLLLQYSLTYNCQFQLVRGVDHCNDKKIGPSYSFKNKQPSVQKVLLKVKKSQNQSFLPRTLFCLFLPQGSKIVVKL